MKTSMQNHIADMKKIQKMVKSKNVDKDIEVTILESIEGCIENAESFFEAEKEQIIEAFEAGTKEDLFNTWSIPEELYKKEKSAEYFQQTFKSDE